MNLPLNTTTMLSIPVAYVSTTSSGSNDAAVSYEMPVTPMRRTKERSDIYVERMLADPMTQLVMRADGVSENEIRTLYRARSPINLASLAKGAPETGPQPGSPRPGIGE